MLTFDTLLAGAIVVGAAIYLYRKLAASKKSGGCGCASGGGCCGSHESAKKGEQHGCMSKH